MKNLFKEIDKRWKEYALAGCVCVLFFVCLTNLPQIGDALTGFVKIFKPIIIGIVIAYIVNPLAVFFEKKAFSKVSKQKLRWALSVVVALVIVVALLVMLVASLIPQLITSVRSFVANYPTYVNHLVSIVESGSLADMPTIQRISEKLSADDGLMAVLGEFFEEHSGSVIATTANVGTAALKWLIGAIFAVYFIMAKEGIKNVLTKFFVLSLSKLQYSRFMTLMSKFNIIFSKYIVCEILDACIIGCVNYLIMALLHMPDALLISVLMGVTNLVPTFGPVVGALIGVFILLLEQPTAILPFVILTVVLQLCDSYVIKPKLFGNALDVPGALILVAIIVFGGLMGVVGMLLAIPFAAIIVYIYTQAFIPWLELKKDLKAYYNEQDKLSK